jgi:hypothetical protein
MSRAASLSSLQDVATSESIDVPGALGSPTRRRLHRRRAFDVLAQVRSPGTSALAPLVGQSGHQTLGYQTRSLQSHFCPRSSVRGCRSHRACFRMKMLWPISSLTAHSRSSGSHRFCAAFILNTFGRMDVAPSLTLIARMPAVRTRQDGFGRRRSNTMRRGSDGPLRYRIGNGLEVFLGDLNRYIRSATRSRSSIIRGSRRSAHSKAGFNGLLWRWS